jgi:transcriptional regulator with XRE-family HTH domain
LNWETGKTEPLAGSLPAVFRWLGYDPFPEPTTLAAKLLKKRRQQGWSIREAALHLGVDPTTWRDWEAGELILFREHRTKVAHLLGLGSQELGGEMRARWNGKHRRWEFRDSYIRSAHSDDASRRLGVSEGPWVLRRAGRQDSKESHLSLLRALFSRKL